MTGSRGSPKRRPGFITLSRDALSGWPLGDLDTALVGDLVRLMGLVDDTTGEFRGSFRYLCEKLNPKRPETLRQHLLGLEAAGRIEWIRAKNQEGESVIKILDYGAIAAWKVADSLADSLADSVGDSESESAHAPSPAPSERKNYENNENNEKENKNLQLVASATMSREIMEVFKEELRRGGRSLPAWKRSAEELATYGLSPDEVRETIRKLPEMGQPNTVSALMDKLPHLLGSSSRHKIPWLLSEATLPPQMKQPASDESLNELKGEGAHDRA